jgi:starch synthase
MKILMITSETVPFAKTGGLADAVPALADALNLLGHDVRIIMPRYYLVDREQLERIPAPLGVAMGHEEMWCGVYKTTLPSTEVPVYMIDREDLFGRKGLYGPDGSSSWPDNALRYALLSSSAFQLCRSINWIPDVLHLHDWQAAPAAWLMKSSGYQADFDNTVSVLTIHNLGYQGIFPAGELEVFSEETRRQGTDAILHGSSLNFLSAGLNCSDEITTVSPTYAAEILQSEYAEGLGDILNRRKDRITGILNGMDYNEWNPAKDSALKPDNYDIGSLEGKAVLKGRLQRESGLPEAPGIPLFGMITRLTGQKGVDLLTDIHGPAMESFRNGKAQLIVLGTGERGYEEAFTALGKAFPESCAVRIAFSGPFSRLIEAGSDFFLMPSRYEPCGLNQMYSLRYGTLPVVRKTGGLADTVIDLSSQPRRGNGFVFNNPSGQELSNSIKRAAAFYKKKRRMNVAVKRAMSLRFDWKSSAGEYIRVYEKALKRL